MKMQNSFRMTLAAAVIAISAAVSSTAALAQGAPRVAMNWQSLGVISGGISVSTLSSPTLLPIGGDTIWACNTGTNDAYLAFGGSSVAAVIGANGTSWLKAGTCSNYSRLNASGQITTYVAALTAAGTTTVALETGVGSGPAQSTSSGGGSGGNVNVTQWASVGLAAPTAWGTAPIGGSIVPNMNVNCLAGCASGTNTTATGTITSTQSVAVTPGAGQSTVGIQVTGTWTGTLFVEGSVDGTNYVQTTLIPILSGSVQTATITANGIFQANVAGLASFRIRGSTVASGTATVTLISSGGAGTVMADNPFPVTGYTGMTALNVIGNTAIGSATSDKPLMMGGSSTGASGGNAQVAKVDSSGNTYSITQGTGASGAALSGNPFRVGLSDGTNAQNWLAAIALADGVNGNNTGAVAAWLWNGTTYDRAYGDKTNGAWVNVKASTTIPTTSTPQAPPLDIMAAASTITTQNGALSIVAKGAATVRFDLASISGSPTVMFECENNQASPAWVNVDAWQNNGNGTYTLINSGTTVSANGSYLILASAGYQACRAIQTATGTLSVTIDGEASAAPNNDVLAWVASQPATIAPPVLAKTNLVKGTTAAMTGVTSTQVVAAVASQHLYITNVHCTNSSATGTLVSIQDGSGGTVLDTLACGATNGGDERNNGSFPLFWTTAGNGLYAQDVTTGASVIVSASGYSSAN